MNTSGDVVRRTSRLRLPDVVVPFDDGLDDVVGGPDR